MLREVLLPATMKYRQQRLRFGVRMLIAFVVSIGISAFPQEQPPSPGSAAAAQPATGTAAPSPPPSAAATPATATPPAEATIDERLVNVRGEIERAKAALPAETPTSPRIDLLTQLQGALERRLSLERRSQELEKQIADQERQRLDFEQNGLEADPPFPLKQLDALRDEVQRAERALETNIVSQRTFDAAARRAEETRKAAEQARRKARDDLDALKDQAKRAALSATLSEVQVRQRVAVEEEALAKDRLALGGLDHELSEARLSLLQEKRDYVEARVAFSTEELQAHLEEIETRRAQLAQQVKSLTNTHAENVKALNAARDAAQAAGNRPPAEAPTESELRGLADKVARWEAIAEATSTGIYNTEQRIAYLADEKKLWENRHAVRLVSDPDQLLAWNEEVDLLLQDLAERREIVESHLEEIRIARLDLEKRLATWDDAQGTKDDAQARLNAIIRLADHESNYLSSLISLERLASRFRDEILAKQESRGLSRQWATVKSEFLKYWNRQILVIDDSDLTPGKLVRAGVVFVLIVAAGSLLKRILLSRFMRYLEFGSKVTRTFTRDFISAVRRQTKTIFLLVLALYFSLKTVPIGKGFDDKVTDVAVVVTIVQFAIWINAALALFVERARRRREALDPSSVSAFGFMLFAGRLMIWGAAFLILYGWYFGREITALMAGFGIGGIAIAFALQNILGDIFCSIAILLDRPFVVGDFIIVGPQMGVVEHIGIKTTRLRSISGEQIIVSNADVLGSRIHNYKRMQERRAAFTIGVVYQTPKEKLERIPGMIREIIEAAPNTRFDRSHFKGFGAFSLDFESVYYVLSSDYVEFMDIQQEINLKLYAKFEEEGIAFAFPTQELIVTLNKPSVGPAIIG